MLLILLIAAGGMAIPVTLDVFRNGERNLLNRAGDELQTKLAGRFGTRITNAGSVVVSTGYLFSAVIVIYGVYVLASLIYRML